MSKLEKTLYLLESIEVNNSLEAPLFDPRACILTTLIYIGIIISIPVGRVDITIWFALYPIISAPVFGLFYSKIFLQSLIVLPFVLFIAIFNPFIDKEIVFYVGSIGVTEGWLTFTGLILRALLCMQSILILIRSMGYLGVVRGMERLGLPKFLTSPLFLVFRYLRVLLEEGLTMRRAVLARCFGKKNLSLRLWGILIGQLFIRSIDRAERINNAMLSRGFSGTLPTYAFPSRWKTRDSLFLFGWVVVFIFLRIFNLSILFK